MAGLQEILDQWAAESNFDPNSVAGKLFTKNPTVENSPIPSTAPPADQGRTFFNYDPAYIKAQEDRATSGIIETASPSPFPKVPRTTAPIPAGQPPIEAPIWRDIKSAGGTIGKGITALGMYGTGYTRLANNIVEYLTGVRSKPFDKLARDVSAAFDEAWGVSPVTTKPPKTGTPSDKSAEPAKSPEFQSGPYAPFTVDMEGNPIAPTSPVKKPRKLSDAEFKAQFNNKDFVPPGGGGYIESGGKMVRIEGEPSPSGTSTPTPESERMRFYQSLVKQMGGYDPIKDNPEKSTYDNYLRGYEKRYGPNANWGPAVYDAFKGQIAEATHQGMLKKQNAMEQVKFAMDMFEKEHAPTHIKSGEMVKTSTGEIITNYPPLPIPQGTAGIIGRTGSYSPINAPKPDPTELTKHLFDIAKGGYISLAEQNFAAKSPIYEKVEPGSKEEKAIMAKPEEAALYNSYKHITSISDEKIRRTALESTADIWAGKDGMVKYQQMITAIANKARGIEPAAPTPATPTKPVVGGGYVKDGKKYRIIKVNPNGTMEVALDNTPTSPIVAPKK